MVEDLGCNAVFGRLRQAAEETCKLATGREYVGCDMRLFYNGNKALQRHAPRPRPPQKKA